MSDDDDERDGKSPATTPPSPHSIHKVIREEGEEQLHRHSGAVAWSGLAAGLSMGFSFLVMAVLTAHLPLAPWAKLIGSLGYTIGFLFVIMGRQQLFTETTLTPVLPILVQFTGARVVLLFKFWAVVLAANLVGTWLFSWSISHESFFEPSTWEALRSIADEAMTPTFWPMVFKSILAGWIIALMVWLLPTAGSARILVIFTLTYVVAVSQLSHAIAGSCEAAFSVLAGSHTLSEYFTVFLFPTVLGNTIGGVALVALLNHAPLAAEA